MSFFRGIQLRVRALLKRQELDSQMEQEIRSHIEMQTQGNIERGMEPKEAYRAALLQFGWTESIKETCREQRAIRWVESLAQDLRYAVRMLRKNPGFTAVVSLTLALGIGASTAIFSIINTIIFHPLPGPEPERLLQIGERSHGNKDEPMFGGLTTPTIEILKTKKEFFSEFVWYHSQYLETRTADFIDGFGGNVVSANFFSTWNIKPMLGRTFSKDEAVRLNEAGDPERDSVIVLSYAFWRSHFAGDRAVLGRTFEGNGKHFTVIGVMPKHFDFPGGAYWIPAENPPPRDSDLANGRVFVRLRPDVTLQQTQAMLDAVARQLLEEYPSIYNSEWRRRGGGFGFLLQPLSLQFTQTPYDAKHLQQTLWGLLAAIGFVLLIVCVNVGNLMLARTEKRQQELAIRAAIGAGRSRLLRQLLTESMLLSCIAAVGGLAVTFLGMKILVSLIPETIPSLRPIQVDGDALAVTLLLALGTAVAFGLVPAWHASRASIGGALKQAGIGASISAGWRRYRGALVVGEVALALLLLTGAGLMIDTVIRLLHINPGFDPEKLLLVHPGLLRGEKYAWSERSAEVHTALFDELRDRFAGLPGVKAVGISKLSGSRLGFKIEGREQPIGLLRAGTGVGESDLFRVMRIPLLAGRYFQKTDIGDKVGTVIVNESMARLCWPGGNALGRRFRDSSGRAYEVVGVVGDTMDLRSRVDEKAEPTFYRPYQEQAASGGFGPFFVVRTDGDPRNLIRAIRDIIKGVESSMTTPWFEVVRQTLYDRTQAQRTYMLYLIIFAGVGLVLSALGIYGVLAYSVARRTREIGIRIAMGAQRSQVMALVMAEGARLTCIGAAVGLLAAFWLTRLLRSQLYEVSPTDPVVFGAVVSMLLAVALLACLLPAIRATRIDPMSALRSE